MTVDPSKKQRHNLAGKPGLNLRNYTPYLAPVQLQLFEIWTAQPDPLARLDGNVIATDQARFGAEGSGAEFEVLTNDVLQVSGVRNCQMVTCRDTIDDKHLIFINLHLHNPCEAIELGDYLRAHQAEQMIHWMKAKEAEVNADKIFVFGDFNTEPGETPYHLMKEIGFKSAYEVINGAEPEVTFPTGIQAPFMDPDPPACYDYIFFKGNNLEVTTAELAADKMVPGDPTLYASDHKAVVADFKI